MLEVREGLSQGIVGKVIEKKLNKAQRPLRILG